MRQLEQSLAMIGARNRDLATRFLHEKQADGARSSTLRIYALWIRRLDAFLQDKPIQHASAEDITRFLAATRATGASDTSLSQAARNIRSFLRWSYDDEELPRRLWRAFKTIGNPQVPQLQPVTDDEYERLLEESSTLRDKAILATLRDTGLRVSELVALNVDSLHFDDKGGAKITLPPDAPNLKTGPRSLYTLRAAPYLRALILTHRVGREPGTPLFVSHSRRSQGIRPSRHNIARHLSLLCRRAGVRRIWPHLFRHTRATEVARHQWNESQMRLFFGWSRFSKMPSHYTHLAYEDLERAVLDEAKRVQADQTRDPSARRLEELLNAILTSTREPARPRFEISHNGPGRTSASARSHRRRRRCRPFSP